MAATIRRDGAMADLLLSWGVNVNAQDDEGVTALMLAARDGNTALVQQLLDRGARVDVRSRMGWTALTYAAWKGHPDIARRLLKAGADPAVADRSGWSPLMHATARAAESSTVERSASIDLLDTRELAARDAARRRYAEVIDLLGGPAKGRGTNRPVAASQGVR
jgi:ankyrin repeat protein